MCTCTSTTSLPPICLFASSVTEEGRRGGGGKRARTYAGGELPVSLVETRIASAVLDFSFVFFFVVASLRCLCRLQRCAVPHGTTERGSGAISRRPLPRSTLEWTVCRACELAGISAFVTFFLVSSRHPERWTAVWVCVLSQWAKWYSLPRSALEVVVRRASSVMENCAGWRNGVWQTNFHLRTPPRLTHLLQRSSLAACSVHLPPFRRRCSACACLAMAHDTSVWVDIRYRREAGDVWRLRARFRCFLPLSSLFLSSRHLSKTLHATGGPHCTRAQCPFSCVTPVS